MKIKLPILLALLCSYLLFSFAQGGSSTSDGEILLSADFTLEQLQSAYDELNTTINKLNSQESTASRSAMDELSDNYLSDIRAWSLSRSQNRIVVQIKQLNKDKEEYFLSLFDSLSPDMFIFEETLGFSLT